MAYDHWNTPEFIVVRLHKIEPVTIDPCSNKQSIVRAKTEIRRPKNGLKAHWTGHTYVNPPFSDIFPWIYRAVNEVFSKKGLRHITLFIPHSPETKYWQLIYQLTPAGSRRNEQVKTAYAVFPQRVRLNKAKIKKGEKFISPMVSNTVVYIGLYPEKFVNAFGDICTIITNWTYPTCGR